MVIDEAQVEESDGGTYVCQFCGHVSNSWLDSQTHMLNHIRKEE